MSILIVNSPVRYCAMYQLSAIVLVTTTLLLGDAVRAYSFALGGIVCAIPNLYFVYYAFRYSGAQHAPLIARSFARGETGKFVLAVVGLVFVYRFVKPVDGKAVLAGFVSMIILQWWLATRVTKLLATTAAETKPPKTN